MAELNSQLLFHVHEFLSTHRGRDKVLRSLQFLARLCGGCLQIYGVHPGEGLINMASSISSARIVLRLLDDITMVGFLLNGIKKVKAKPTLLSLLDLTDTIVGLVFLPVEHLAFFGDQKLATYQTDSLHTASTVLWLTSLLLNLSQLLIKIASSSVSSSSLILPLVQCSSDIVLAVHYLPQGLLWSQKLPLPAVGLFGLISSLVGLYRLINDYRSKKLKS